MAGLLFVTLIGFVLALVGVVSILLLIGISKTLLDDARERLKNDGSTEKSEKEI